MLLFQNNVSIYINSYYDLGKNEKTYEVISGSYSSKRGITTINYKDTSFNDPTAYAGSTGYVQKINVTTYITNWSDYSNCVVSATDIYSGAADTNVNYSYSYDNTTGILTINDHIMNATNDWKCVLY